MIFVASVASVVGPRNLGTGTDPDPRIRTSDMLIHNTGINITESLNYAIRYISVMVVSRYVLIVTNL